MKLISFVFEYLDGTLELHEDVKGWEHPRLNMDIQGVYHLGSPDYSFWKHAMTELGPSEHYCVIPVDRERYDELKVEVMLND